MEDNAINVPNSLNLKIWAKLFPFLKTAKKQIFLVLIFMLASAVIESTYPLFTKYAVNSFVTPQTTKNLAGFAAVFFAFILIEGVTVVLFSRQSMLVEMTVGKFLRRACFLHLQELPLSYYNSNSVGFLLARVLSDTERISGMVSWGFAHMAWNLCYILSAVVIMFTLHAGLALILVLIIPAVALITWLFERKILVVNRRVREINSRITGAYNEGITGAKASKTLVIEDLNVREFGGLTDKMYRESVKSSMLTAVMLPLITFCGSVAVGAVLYRGGILVQERLLDFGILSAFITYAVGIIEPVVQIANIITDMVSAQVGIERVSALLSEPVTIKDSDEVTAKYGGLFDPKEENWEPVKGGVTFENVSFKYPGSEEYVLENFSLQIPAGTTVAIVGETGAGKSTMVNLVCRFFEPTSGRILIDGADYKERSQLWLHSALGYVLQDPHLFSGTIRENIRYGRLNATDEEIDRAARLVSADTVVKKLPQGYDAEVGEGGDRLSTGEKQLISFARAIIADPPIFILDEATSSIDTETELLIQNAISHILEGRTSIIIAHRLSTISRADIILVVEDGKIVERGTHAELIASGGHYSGLYRAMQLEDRYKL